MEKQIKGTINYTLNITENGDWQVEYEAGVENEMAALSIAQHCLENSIAQVSLQKKESKGQVKKSLSTQLDKFVQARFGINLLCDILVNNYDNYLEYKKKHEEEMKTAELSDKEKQDIIKAVAAPNNHTGKP